MEIELWKKPKAPTIVEGFPGFGLIGTITTEFLIGQLKATLIGRIRLDDIPAMVAIHDGKVIYPVGIYHAKKENIVIIHVVTNVKGVEWQVARAVSQVAKQLGAKELISVEGVASQNPTEGTPTFYYSNLPANQKRFEKVKIEKLKEGVIVGVTGALLVERCCPVSAVFVETQTGLPDSKAAAEVIKVLDKYLRLKVDPAPLYEQAQKFEEKLKTIVDQTNFAKTQADRKKLSYVG